MSAPAALQAFEPKLVQGLYNLAHFERGDGAWYQVPYGRGDITYCASPSSPFLRFPTLAALAAHLECNP
jgi:hypothetical protein